MNHRKDSRQPKTHAAARGYDAAWRRLSERARKLQPFCTDCGTTEDLTADHTPEAWERKRAGKPIRLRDVDVVCRSCNSKRGEAKAGPREIDRQRQADPLRRKLYGGLG